MEKEKERLSLSLSISRDERLFMYTGDRESERKGGSARGYRRKDTL
jgi:hypothetical protein